MRAPRKLGRSEKYSSNKYTMKTGARLHFFLKKLIIPGCFFLGGDTLGCSGLVWGSSGAAGLVSDTGKGSACLSVATSESLSLQLSYTFFVTETHKVHVSQLGRHNNYGGVEHCREQCIWSRQSKIKYPCTISSQSKKRQNFSWSNPEISAAAHAIFIICYEFLKFFTDRSKLVKFYSIIKMYSNNTMLILILLEICRMKQLMKWPWDQVDPKGP